MPALIRRLHGFHSNKSVPITQRITGLGVDVNERSERATLFRRRIRLLCSILDGNHGEVILEFSAAGKPRGILQRINHSLTVMLRDHRHNGIPASIFPNAIGHQQHEPRRNQP